jgi:hypothetical protein
MVCQIGQVLQRRGGRQRCQGASALKPEKGSE